MYQDILRSKVYLITYWYVPGYTSIKSISYYILVCTGIYFWIKVHIGTNALVHRQSQAGSYEYGLVCTNILVFIQVVEIPDGWPRHSTSIIWYLNWHHPKTTRTQPTFLMSQSSNNQNISDCKHLHSLASADHRVTIIRDYFIEIIGNNRV
jgi:hypothetical protein